MYDLDEYMFGKHQTLKIQLLDEQEPQATEWLRSNLFPNMTYVGFSVRKLRSDEPYLSLSFRVSSKEIWWRDAGKVSPLSVEEVLQREDGYSKHESLQNAVVLVKDAGYDKVWIHIYESMSRVLSSGRVRYNTETDGIPIGTMTSITPQALGKLLAHAKRRYDLNPAGGPTSCPLRWRA